jgi:hypothetical protein
VTVAASDPQQALGAAASDSSQQAPAAVASTVGVQHAPAGDFSCALVSSAVAAGGAQQPVEDVLNPKIFLPSVARNPLPLVAMVCCSSCACARQNDLAASIASKT